MPRRPTSSPSDRSHLRDRLDDVTDGDDPTYNGEEIHEPGFVVALSAHEESRIDDDLDLYRIGGDVYHVPDGILGEWF